MTEPPSLKIDPRICFEPLVPVARRPPERYRARRSRARTHIRAMAPMDLEFVVRQHQQHFPDGFFVRLGSRFLREYYRAFLTGPHAYAYLAERHGHRVGYLVGIRRPGTHRQHVLREHGLALAGKALLSMLAHPSLGWFFVRTRARLYASKLLRSRRHTAASGAGSPLADTAVLTHVAVAKHAQSLGIGSMLIKRFEDDAAAVGCRRIVLVTASGDSGAGGYYERMGWQAKGEHCTRDGVPLMTYERSIVRPQAGDSGDAASLSHGSA